MWRNENAVEMKNGAIKSGDVYMIIQNFFHKWGIRREKCQM